jgi:hypothetical protein
MKLSEEGAYLAMLFATVCLSRLSVVNVLMFWFDGGMHLQRHMFLCPRVQDWQERFRLLLTIDAAAVPFLLYHIIVARQRWHGAGKQEAGKYNTFGGRLTTGTKVK